MKIWIFVVKFLLIGSLFIVSNNDLSLIDNEERQEFYSLFTSWLNSLVGHVSDISGYVVKSEWLPNKDLKNNIEEVIE